MNAAGTTGDYPAIGEVMEQTKEPLDVLTVGETLVDFISVEQTDTLRNTFTFRKHLGGSPANIAVNIAKMGGRAAVLSKTGIGAFGRFLKSELQYHGVFTDYLVMDHRTHTSIIFVTSTSGTPDFEDFRQGDFLLTPAEVPEEAIERTSVVHASTFALSLEPCRSAVEKAFRLAHEAGKTVSLDPNYSLRIWPDHKEAQNVIERMYRYVDVTKPSLDDARRIFGRGKAKDPEPEEYIRLFHELGPRTVVFTMGEDGILVSQNGSTHHVPARPVEVVDATGAGDSFWAGYLMALLDGKSPAQCALFAREIVEMKLTNVGPLPEEIDREEVHARARAAEKELKAGEAAEEDTEDETA
jgi:fructokinase